MLKSIIILCVITVLSIYCTKDSGTNPNIFANKDPNLIGSWLPVSNSDDTLTFSSTQYYRHFTDWSADDFISGVMDGNWYTTKDSLIIQCKYIRKTYDDSTMQLLKNTTVNNTVPVSYCNYVLETKDSLRIKHGSWSSFKRLK